MSNALNLDDADYNRRDNTTALSFPKLNAEILAKVYRQINDFYGVDKKDWLSKHSDDEKLVSLVKSANFPKLYAKELLDTKVILKTPERTEDVHGDWFEYKLGDEEEIASLAEGTKWCVVDPNVAHNYLVYGEYGHSSNKGADEKSNSKAKFIIFRLEDPNSPGVFASNGSASIRLDPNGIVAEISGLNEGQAVEDALVPIVKEKALSLPGGEKYLQKFDDKQTLIKLDNKRKEGEDLTKEELSFLYELGRPIATLDTYNRKDPRIPELKEKYGIEYALEKGVDTNKLVPRLDYSYIKNYLGTLLEHGADINKITNRLEPTDIFENLDIFLEHGANINDITSNMDSYDIVRRLDILFEHGADINKITNRLKPSDIVLKLDTLLEHGANININQLVSKLSPECTCCYLDTLLEHGADININQLTSEVDPAFICSYLDTLLEHGADINKITNRLKPTDIFKNFDFLLEHGANININQLVSKLRPLAIYERLDTFLEHGADVNIIINKLDEDAIKKNIDLLRKYGANL